MMRRYTLNIGNREFVVDVQETDSDQFEVQVGGEAYVVTLNEDVAVGGAAIAPAPAAAPRAAAPAPAAPAAAPKPAAAAAPRKQPAGAGGKGALKAPMPGAILEVNVKPGDTVTRGQQLAILDAMKMHNVIGAPRDGVIAEVCVEAGQSVGHGDVIVTFKED
jgi:biotin carboxyl carrier protein